MTCINQPDTSILYRQCEGEGKYLNPSLKGCLKRVLSCFKNIKSGISFLFALFVGTCGDCSCSKSLCVGFLVVPT